VHVKPRLRGLLHQYAFFASLPALLILLCSSPTGRATVAATVYGLSLVAMFGVSALYHRVTWSVGARRWMGRLDHAMINVLIAGTFTPLGVLVLSGTLATASLVLMWGGAIASTLLHVFWIDAPKWLSAVVYVVLGWGGAATLPRLVSHVGWGPTALLALGGALLGRRGRLRAPPSRPRSRGVRLPRGVPRARDRGGCYTLRGRRALRAPERVKPTPR